PSPARRPSGGGAPGRRRASTTTGGGNTRSRPRSVLRAGVTRRARVSASGTVHTVGPADGSSASAPASVVHIGGPGGSVAASPGPSDGASPAPAPADAPSSPASPGLPGPPAAPPVGPSPPGTAVPATRAPAPPGAPAAPPDRAPTRAPAGSVVSRRTWTRSLGRVTSAVPPPPGVSASRTWIR